MIHDKNTSDFKETNYREFNVNTFGFRTPVVHLAQNHLVQKRPLSAKLFRAKFNHPKVQLAQNSVL